MDICQHFPFLSLFIIKILKKGLTIWAGARAPPPLSLFRPYRSLEVRSDAEAFEDPRRRSRGRQSTNTWELGGHQRRSWRCGRWGGSWNTDCPSPGTRVKSSLGITEFRFSVNNYRVPVSRWLHCVLSTGKKSSPPEILSLELISVTRSILTC